MSEEYTNPIGHGLFNDMVNNSLPLSSANNFERLAKNKVSKKFEKIFRSIPTDDVYSLGDKALDNIEGQSEDNRYDKYDEAFELARSFDRLLNNLQKKGQGGYGGMNLFQRREYLKSIAKNDYIYDTLKKLTNECIVTDKENTKFADVKINDELLKEYGISDDIINKIQESVKKSTPKIYNMLGLYNDGAWFQMIRWLIEGRLAWQIIFDDNDKPTKILGFVQKDALALQPFYDKGMRFWRETYVERNTNQTKTNLFNDGHIIMIDWSDTNMNGRMSYLEQILRAFNMLNTIEEVKLMYAVANAPYRTNIKVPTNGMSPKKAVQTVNEERNRYTDSYFFDNDSGSVTLNGSNNLASTRQIFSGDNENGGIDIESIANEGPDLHNLEEDEYFLRRYYRSTGIPRSRFDDESSETWTNDPTQTYRYEISFSRDVGRYRMSFGKILLQPILQQLMLDVPEIRGNSQIIDAIFLDYASYNEFIEMLKMEILSQKLGIIGDINDAITVTSPNGDEEPYIPIEHHLKKYLYYTDEDIKEITSMRKKQLEDRILEQKDKKDLMKKHGLEED